MSLAIASAIGLVLFLWPFLGLQLPPEAPAIVVATGTVLALGLVELGARRLDSRRLALLAALAAIDSALRLALVTGIGGFSPVFFLILCAGWVFGPSFGFLTGGTALLVSALATGGVGPWLPYQVFAAGWVGVAAGLAARGGGGLWLLAAIGVVTGFAFGALMDVWDWTYFRGSPGLGWTPGLAPLETLARFGRFYLVSSLAYDSFRAAGNAVLVVILGPPVLAALSRLRSRLLLEVIPQPPVVSRV